MKTKLIYCLLLLFLLLSVNEAYSQPQDNSFQKYYSKVSAVLNKPASELNDNDMLLLNDIMHKNDLYFGESNQAIVKSWKQSAKNKLAERTNYEEERKHSQELLTEETSKRTQAESQVTTLTGENKTLKEQIEALTQQISKLETERKNLQRANKKLIESNKVSNEELKKNSQVVQRISDLLGSGRISNEMQMQLPKNSLDSLQAAECGVSELLKNNYLLLLKSIQNDKVFMDSTVKYYRENKRFSPELNSYAQRGIELSNKLMASNSECVKANGKNIQDAITDFQNKIESEAGLVSFWDKLGNFFKSAAGIVVIIIILLIIIGLILLGSMGKVKLLVTYTLKDGMNNSVIDYRDSIRDKSFKIPQDKLNYTILTANYNSKKNVGGKVAPAYTFHIERGYRLEQSTIPVDKGSGNFDLSAGHYSLQFANDADNKTYLLDIVLSRLA